MASPKKTLKQPTDDDGFMSLLTTGQLVVAISVSLCYGLACFLLGVLVGKYDSSLHPAEPVQQVVSTDIGAAAPELPTVAPLRKKPPVQTSPRPNVIRPPAPVVKPYKPTAPDRPAPIHSATPPSQPPAALPSAPEERPPEALPPTLPAGTSAPGVKLNAVEAPMEKVKPPKEEVETPTTDKKESGPALSVMVPQLPELPELPSSTVNNRPAPKVSATSTPASAGSSEKRTGGFGIQVASLLGADRKQKALAFAERLRDNDGKQCVIIPSDDDQYHRVVIVGFGDRAAAEKACAQLRKNPEFADAFIKVLPN